MREQPVIPRLPAPDVYELEYQFWPWGKLLKIVENWIVEHAPFEGYVVDYMCGCGFLLDAISKRRADLRLQGNTFDEDWQQYGKKHYSQIDIQLSHSLEFKPSEQVDVAIVTGSIHHLLPHEQPQFIARAKNDLKPSGCFIIGEEVIAAHTSDRERRLAALQLGERLLAHVIKRQAPPLVLEAAIDLLKRDLFRSGEYKISLSDLKAMVEDEFEIVKCDAIWPSPDAGFGDYLLICKPRIREYVSQ